MMTMGARDQARRTIGDVMLFVERWVSADSAIVQHWNLWQQEACSFFGLENHPLASVLGAGHMHDVMRLTRSVCLGTPDDVKRAAREMMPASLALADQLLGHLPAFSVVMDAEKRFRWGDLAGDWSLALIDGRLVVRSEIRGAESKH